MSLLRDGIEILYKLNTKCDCGSGVRARRVWQQLFNCYRMFDGDLSNLDNLLVDYQNLLDYFNKYENFEVAWYMSYKWYGTTMTDVKKYKNDSQMDLYNCGDVRVKIKYDPDKEEVLLDVLHLEGKFDE